MSSSRHSQGVRREVLRPRYEDQDFLLYRDQGTKGNFSQSKTLGVDDSPYSSPVHRERKYRPSYVLSRSSSRSQRDDLAPYSETAAHIPGYSQDLSLVNTKSSKGRKYRSSDESVQARKTRAETPSFPRPITLESMDSTRLPSPHTPREKTVRFSDMVYLDDGSPDRYPGNRRHHRDALRGQAEDDLAGTLGNGDGTGEFDPCEGYIKILPKSSRAGERQRSYVPAAPVIPRLPTPDFDLKSHHEINLAKYDFCPCCTPGYGDEEDGAHWKKGKAKMDKQGMPIPFKRPVG
ncbi:hypothetical protein O1611_g6663 [Lasiodiplodia mahajangana]|uniref:Uncharacterized protein n=1 Tax=Lasiodiplodia mahajangana TaxID=1108764 RepID=A0ACC2JHP6_9PEZI|nr:hypothetical protein O1611_g6663 [Lasiodiplodia mahajangana]